MGALSDIQEILKSDNLDNPLFGIKPLMEAWVEELSSLALPTSVLSFTYGTLLYEDQRAFPATVDRGDLEGFSVSITSQPVVIAALGTVIDLSTINGQYANLPLSDDEFDLLGYVKVTNMAGTQVALAHKSIGIDAETASGSMDWSSPTTSVPTGTDLAWTGTAVASTAGGIFVVTVILNGGWD